MSCAQVEDDSELAGQSEALDVNGTAKQGDSKKAQIARGRDLWIKETFGGEKLLPSGAPAAAVLARARSRRDAAVAARHAVHELRSDQRSRLYAGRCQQLRLDKCLDPGSAGVVGVRKFNRTRLHAAARGTDPPVLVGVSCAGCHAGLDAQNPPRTRTLPAGRTSTPRPAISTSTSARSSARTSSPTRSALPGLHTWAPGTVDTTAIESDGINNPGIITQFFNLGNASVTSTSRSTACRSPCIAPARAARTTPAARRRRCASTSTSACARPSAWSAAPGQRPGRHADADRPGRVRARLPRLRAREKRRRDDVHVHDDATPRRRWRRAGRPGAACPATSKRRARPRRSSQRTARRAIERRAPWHDSFSPTTDARRHGLRPARRDRGDIGTNAAAAARPTGRRATSGRSSRRTSTRPAAPASIATCRCSARGRRRRSSTTTASACTPATRAWPAAWRRTRTRWTSC